MPTKEYIQLLQRLYVYLKRNSGRNVPHGISQITLIDDDDLTRWFVQLLYKDENNADFYVSLELVFNEDVDSEDTAAGGAWGVSGGIGGAGSRHRRPSRHMEPSASATMLAAADTAPQSAAETSSPHVHRHDTTTTSSPAPPAQPSSSLTSSGAGDKVRATAERIGGRKVAPRAVASSRDGSNGARTSDRSTQQQRQQNDDDANSVPTPTTPQPYNDFQCRLVALSEARRPPSTSEGHMALPENADGAGVAAPHVNDPSQPLARPQTSAFASPPPPTAATGGSRRRARMPLVFVVAPRLIASFIHHGALCSLELMSQDWELTPENMVLLLIALFETLNPFAGDGRVSVDDAERMEHLRETVAAWGVGGGGSSTLAAAYSEEEHRLGMEFIRRAHPHLFRRYVGPLSEYASAARDGMPSLPVPSESRGGLSASANPNIAAAAATGGGMVQRDHRDMYFDSGSAVAATGSDSVRPSASPHSAQTATTTPSLMEFGTGHGRGSSGALAPRVLRDVSHLNTAVYDALVATYAPPLEPSPVSPPPPLCPTLAQQQPRPTAATAKPVVMLLDSPALLADAEGVRLFQSGVRGVQQAVVSTTVAGEDKYSAADSTTPNTPADRDRVGASPEYSGSSFPSLPTPLQQRTPSTMTATPPPSSSASTLIFAPVMNAERVLRARPPALWHVAYAPTHPHTAAASCEKAQLLQQRVAELWIPFTLPPPPPSISGSSTAVSGIPATSSAEDSQVTQVLRLAEAGVSCERGAADCAAVPLPLEVHLIGDAGDNVQQARVACVLRNVRVSATAARTFSSTANPLLNVSNGGSTSTTQRPSLRFSLQSSTAPSPAGDVHACHLPRGLTLHCRNMYLYGHLRVFGNLVLDSCVFVGSLTTEELASVQVSRSHLALMPDDRLLLRQPPYRKGPSDRCRGAGRGAPRQRASSTASPGAADAARPPPPPPPPALFYAQRKECVLVLDSSRVEMSEDTHVYRLMPNFHAAAAAAATRGWQRRTQEAETEKRSGEPDSASFDRDEDEGSDEVASVSDSEEDSGDEGKAAAAAVAPSLAAMMAVLRSLILVSNQARLRLVRCTIHPGRNTERTVFAEQNAIVDMAYCTVTAAISSAVSVQGCRAYLEHCFFEGSPTTTAAATSAVLSAEAAAAQEASANDVGTESGHDTASDRSEIQQQPPAPIHVNDTTRCTGLNVELGGTLTARYCAARHLYFAFCVIAHSVAHFYRCHAEDVVNGFTVDASAATLDGCSADTNHVGAFVLRKAKCILTDDSGGSFPRRCSLLGEAHETACRAVTEALRQQHQETRGGGVGPPAITETESLWTSAAAVAERTARVALLARRHYAEQLPRSDTLSDAAPVTTTATHAPHRRSQTSIGMSSPRQTLGFFGGRFSLEVRDAALKATGVMLMNAHDTSVYAYENSVVELEECVLWSTAEAEEAASEAAATVAAALGSAESPAAAASAAALKLTGRRALTGADGTFDGQLRSGSPRQRSCGVKVVHASLKARRCLMAGYSFGLAAIQSAQAELQECLVVNAINGYTIDHSQCRLRHCGADTSHVGLFALNGSRVEAESTPHVVGVSSCGRTPPPLICGGVPAVFCGDVYGVEIQSSEVECTGITVLRGRDSGFNAYNGSTLRLSKCLVDMSPADAAGYVFHRPSSGGAAGAVAAVGVAHEKRSGSSTNKGDAAGMAGLWTHHLHLDVSDAVHAHSRNRLLEEQQGDTVPHRDEGGEDGRGEAMRAAAPAATTTPTTATPPLAPSSAGRVAPAVRTSGVKVWSGSQCHAQDTEVRCVTFGFASLGPETLLDAHHCSAKHVVNGFTSDGGALQLTKCSASSNHVGVYVLSHARCVVRCGSYTAKKYGIECRSGVLSLQGHVKIYGFSRIGMYLYDGAHCEADPDCVLDIHALKHASPGSSADVTAAAVPAPGSGIRSGSLLQLSKTQQPQPPMSTASTTSLCSPEDAANVSDLLPACIALDEATAHLPQAVLGGGARCGVTCGDGATGFIGKCIVYDCSLVGVNVFYGAHLTLANALLRCAQQYAVVVHVGGVCRIIQNAEGDETGDDDDGLAVDSSDEGVNRGARGSGGLGSILRRHGPGAAVSAAVRRLRRLASHIVAVPWRVAHQWAGRRDPNDGAAAAESVAEDSSGCGAVLSGARARSLATGSIPGAPPTPRHPPSRVADKAQRLSPDASSRWRGETRSAISRSSATAATASPVAIGGGGGALLVGDDDDEVGGRRTLPLTSALRRRLKWLCWETCLGAPLPFRLNTLTMPVATVGASGAGPEPGSTAASVAECQPFSLSPSASCAAAPTSGAPAITSVFLPVRPTICGSCVVRGTCTMERVVLRPTNHLPRLFAECSRADRARNSGKEHDDDATTATATDDEDGAMDTARDSAGNVAALRTRRSPWPGQEVCNSADDTTSTGEQGGDSAYASRLLATAATIKPSLAAGRTVAAASARPADGWAALPSACVLHHLVRQPPGVHVCQQGVLNLTDCIVDASLSPQPYLGARRAGQIFSAVVACEGPYAKLHCDYVRVVRGESGDEDGRTVIEGGDGGASSAARPATFPALTRSSALPALSPDAAPPLLAAVAAAAADVATVPLLLVSLVDGAQCTLHMVGASLDDWPYCAYGAGSINQDGNVCSDPMTGAEKEDAGNPLGFAGRGGTAAVQLSPARLISARNAGVMLRTTGDTLAEVTYASIAGIVASQRSQVWLAHCTVTGMVPIILGSGSYSSLTCCRVVGGARAGPAAAAIRVEDDGDLTLIRSSVWTLSQGLAVECVDSGCVHAVDSEELTLGRAAGSADGHGDCE